MFFQWSLSCTKFEGSISELGDILARVIQSSALSLASFTVTASVLWPLYVVNLTNGIDVAPNIFYESAQLVKCAARSG